MEFYTEIEKTSSSYKMLNGERVAMFSKSEKNVLEERPQTRRS